MRKNIVYKVYISNLKKDLIFIVYEKNKNFIYELRKGNDKDTININKINYLSSNFLSFEFSLFYFLLQILMKVFFYPKDN